MFGLRGRQERANFGLRVRPAIEHGHVAAVLEDDELALRDLPVELLPVSQRRQLVLCAPDQQHGHGDSGQLAVERSELIGLSQYPAVYRFLADALIRTGQAARALALLEEAAARWPDNQALGARVMRAHLEAGHYGSALEYADQIIARQPSDSATLFLAMRSIFQAVLEGADVDRIAWLPRLQRYQELYVAAGGQQQALVAEWVTFVKART